jgi:predicted amidophosphoribosyltransferase
VESPPFSFGKGTIVKTLNMADEPDSLEPMRSGWIYAFGLYQPRWKIAQHLNSDWSQAVMLAKRKSETVIEGFGKIIARHLETVLAPDEEYIITHVPAEEDHELYLFLDFKRCATEVLAQAIYCHLKELANVLMASVLIQVKPKARKQRQCTSDKERAENVSGIYAATHSSLMVGKIVILVDDVLTSGATMRECADVLKSAGAKSVMGIALAKTDRIKAPVFATDQENDQAQGEAA